MQILIQIKKRCVNISFTTPCILFRSFAKIFYLKNRLCVGCSHFLRLQHMWHLKNIRKDQHNSGNTISDPNGYWLWLLRFRPDRFKQRFVQYCISKLVMHNYSILCKQKITKIINNLYSWG